MLSGDRVSGVRVQSMPESDKTPWIVYTDFMLLIKKVDVCKNSLEDSFTTKVGEYILCIFFFFFFDVYYMGI